MTKFQINSEFYSNVCLILDKEITNKMCKLQINEFKAFEIPLFRLISSSSIFIQQILSDLTKDYFTINIPFNNNITEEFIQKIEKALNQEEIELKNDEEIINFALFGKSIKNQCFLDVLSANFNEEITNENVIKLIKTKYLFGYQLKEIEKEISFVSENFSKFKEELHELVKDISYQFIIESIIKNNKLKLENEDELLEFVLELCKENKEYEYLFEFVWLEYCSVSIIKELIEYSNENIFITRSSKAVSSCFSRRLIQEKIPIDLSNSKEARYCSKNNEYKENNENEKYIEYNDADPLYGILRHENENNNVILEATSRLDTVYNILNNHEKAEYRSDNIPNSWIKATLRNKKSFILNKYMIRGRDYPNGHFDHLKTWLLEGQKLDGTWIELDSQKNQEIWNLKIKIYPIKVQEPLISVRLTQTDKSTDGDDNFGIN